ncbi:MAG: hypothetical protein V4466_11470 [Pseudomonadota bacterium]
MRIITPIHAPVRDEHVLEVDPQLRPEIPDSWRRRINPFTGRALSDKALTAEQNSRSGAQRLRGQGLTAGTVHGLDLQLEPGAAGAKPADVRFQLLPGMGLTQWGEDVVISTPRRLSLADLPVYLREDQLNALIANKPGLPGDPDGAQTPDPDSPTGGILERLRPRLPRKIGPAFSEILKKAAVDELPRAAILVAEPITATILGRPDTDGCPPDPRDHAYDDLQLIDGCRLTLFFWPGEMTALTGSTDYSMPGLGPDFRNRLAYRVFNVERSALPGEYHPWERRGLPLALIGFKADWSLDFIDRGAVTRIGGQPMPRTPLVAGAGSALLWQARLAQFVEHMGELGDPTPAALAAAFRQIPPVGFLPRSVFDLQTRRQSFFPPGFRISAAPVPLEHVDVAVGDAASLIPLSLDTADTVELLVPVPERVYEPGLLEIGTVDPAFAQAIARFVADRTTWLVRREMVRRRRDLLIDGITGRRPGWLATDLPAAETLPYPLHRGPVTATRIRRIAAGTATQGHGFGGAVSSLDIGTGDQVYVWVRIADAAGLTNLTLRLGEGADATGGGDLSRTVFWGQDSVGPSGNTPPVRLGDLPAAGGWVRLEIPSETTWGAGVAFKSLVGIKVNGLQFHQVGGTVEWGPVGKISAGGEETVYLGDDGPPGARLTAPTPAGAPAPWPFQPASAVDTPVEADFGTTEADGVREIAAIAEFRGRWKQTFLAQHFTALEEAGLDSFIADLDARLNGTNDAVDLGFVRARADIYRVRSYMLGADAASRLVTSPALADLAVREEGARAKSLDLSAFVKTAYQTDYRRNPDEPLETKKKPATAPATPTEPPKVSTGTFATGVTMGMLRTFDVSASPSIRGLTTPAVQPQAFVQPQLQPMIMAQPLVFQPMLVAQPAAAVTSAGISAAAFASAQPARFATGSISASALRAGLTPTVNFRDIQAQLALPGRVERTASVAERLAPPPSVEAHAFALEGKLTVINTIAGLMIDPTKAPSGQARPDGIALADLPAPGFRYKPTTAPGSGRVRDTVGDVIKDREKAEDARDYEDMDDVPKDSARHEADYFNAAVRAIDNTIALMRLVEARIALYRSLLDDARAVRTALGGVIRDTEARLRTIDIEVEEARHDVGVTESLLAEETERVNALNARRARIIEDHVKVVLFRRPRRGATGKALPSSPATAALTESPIAACLREHDDVPEEIREYAALFREGPVAWFPAVRNQLHLIDRLEAVRLTLSAVRLRASAYRVLPSPPPVNTAPKMLMAVRSALTAQRVTLDQRRLVALQMDTSIFATATLVQAQRELTDRASLADLIAGDHNRPALARMAAQEVDQIGQVAACLHASFGETPPIVRLGWAEILSEFDRPAPLDRLSGLPRWNELPLELKRTQQGFVDWLFARIDRTVPAAESAINELVRVCILMAAHAPVDQIIPAHLVTPARAEVGVRLDLAVDIRRVRVGMLALVRGDDDKPIAHATVEDLSDGLARARIIKTFVASSSIGATARIELGGIRRS